MPRTIALHPFSLVLGAAMTAVVLLSMSQATVGTPTRIEYMAHPRDMVQIQGGTPYTVPPGKILCVSMISRVAEPGLPPFNDNPAVQITRTSGNQEIVTEAHPACLVAKAGDVVQATGITWVGTPATWSTPQPSTAVWVYGYLVNQ